MVQTQEPTNQGFGEIAKLVAGTATKLKSVMCYKTGCTAAAASTYAAPGGTKCTESGVTIADATITTSTTTQTDDTAELDHVFTAGEAVTVTGFGWCNDDNDVLFGECCLAASVAMVTNDTLTVEAKMQFKKD